MEDIDKLVEAAVASAMADGPEAWEAQYRAWDTAWKEADEDTRRGALIYVAARLAYKAEQLGFDALPPEREPVR